MGYNIELSFNILKNSSITELLNDIKLLAENCGCSDFYDDYEFENKFQFERRHCIISVDFSQEKINNMIEFLISVKKFEGVFIELIYDLFKNKVLYASQYYITNKMDKYTAKEFKLERKTIVYSDIENVILNIVLK